MNEIVRPTDNQDKQAWCEYGEKLEMEFALKELHELQISGFVNPEKYGDPYAIDLCTQWKTDLKVCNTPFFTAHRYNMESQYTITFDCKDAKRYRLKNPDGLVLFKVEWLTTSATFGGKSYSVNPMLGYYIGFLDNLAQSSQRRNGGITHAHQQRVNDTKGNGKDVFLLDVRDLHELGKGRLQ